MNILVAVDLAHEPEAIVERARSWAERLDARIDLCTAAPLAWETVGVMGGAYSATLAQEWTERVQALEAGLLELVKSLPDERVGAVKVLEGPVGPTLTTAAADYDLVLVGTHGRRGAARLFLGSVAERLVRQAPTPVLIAPSEASPAPSEGPLQIVVPVEARELDLSAVETVRGWFGDSVVLHVVYALVDLRLSERIGTIDGPIQSIDEHPHRDWAQRRLDGALAEAGIEASVHLVLASGSNPAADLAAFVDSVEADLVAMPTHGRTGWSHVAFGSVTERLVRLAKTSCLVLR